MTLLLDDALLTAPFRVPLSEGWADASLPVEAKPGLVAADVGAGDVALLPSAEATLLAETHVVLPEIAIVVEGPGPWAMRTPVRPDAVEESLIRLLDVSGTGELLMLGAICSWAVYTLVGRRALTQLSPVAATTYAALWGLLFLAIGAVPQLGQIDWAQVGWKAYASVGYLGAFGTVIGFVWYYEGVKALGASRAAVFNNLVPVFGVTFAALLLGEPVLLSMVLGGAVAVAGVTLTNR